MKKLLLYFLMAMMGMLMFSSVSAAENGGSGRGKSLGEARRALEQQLLHVPGFAGIAHSEEKGEIVVFVENEQAKAMAPDRYEGHRVKKEVTGRFRALSTLAAEQSVAVQTAAANRLNATDQLLGGISLSAYVEGQNWAGTLGMITYDNRILSNAHVIAMDLQGDFLAAGTPVIQPGGYDGGKPEDRVGELVAYIPILYGERVGKSSNFKYLPQNYADAAIASVDEGVEAVPGGQFDESENYNVLGTVEVVEGDWVRKSGRTSNTTTGTVYSANASVLVQYSPEKVAYFVDQIIVNQPFSSSGDSGSMVDKGGRAVGLVFAGSETRSIICKIKYIVDGLKIDMGDGAELVSIHVTPADSSILVNETMQFTATGVLSDGSTKNLTAEVAWSSSNTGVATISGGLATGVSAGTTTISASKDGVTHETSLTVTAPPAGTAPVVSGIVPNSARLGQQLTVSVYGTNFQNGAVVDFGERIAVQRVTFVNSSEIRAQIKVHSRAQTGARNVTVINPDKQSGTMQNGFTVNP